MYMKKLIVANSGRDELFNVRLESLEDFVDLPFNLNDEDVQYEIAEWAIDRLFDYLNSDKQNKKKGLEFWPDDINCSSKRISFKVMEGLNNYIGTFESDLNFYDGPSESYDDVEYLIDTALKDFI